MGASMPLILVHKAVAHGPGLEIADKIMLSLISTTSPPRIRW